MTGVQTCALPIPKAAYLSGLYVNVAHGSRGICSGFVCGDVLAGMVVGEPLPVGKGVVDYLSLGRFLVRRLKKGEFLG